MIDKNYGYEPTIGLGTDREKRLTEYIGNYIADYIEKDPTDRRELLAALSMLLRIVICNQTPLDVEGQINEIEGLSSYLKNCALGIMP